MILIYILLQFRRNIQKLLYKTPCLNQEEKHACNPRTRSCLNMGLSAEKNASHNDALQVSLKLSSLSSPESLDMSNCDLSVSTVYKTAIKNCLLISITERAHIILRTMRFKQYCCNAK